MRTYLPLLFSIALSINAYTQSSTQSTFSFNIARGLSSANEQTLDNVYHSMNDLNYHCFNLVSKEELRQYQQPKIIRLIKERANKIIDYYQSYQQVEPENIFIKYGGKLPTLWLHKPTSKLTASGNVVLEDENKQCYSYNPSINNTITSDNGNRFYFPAAAFETLDGNIVTNQNITICLWEFIDKKTLVFSGLTTDANGKMLETAGSFYIEATLNGEELKLRKGETYTVEMQSNKSFNDMFTYYGNTKDGIIDWDVNKNERAIYNGNSQNEILEPETDEEVEIEQEEYQQYNNFNEYGDVIDGAYLESEEAVNFYEMSAGKLGWINCDRFYEVKNTSTLAVRVDSDKPMVVRLVFRNIDSVMPCYGNSNHKDQYEASGIPTGEKVLLLAYSVKDNDAVFGYKEITVGENKIENITLNNLSKTRFKSAVSELLY